MTAFLVEAAAVLPQTDFERVAALIADFVPGEAVFPAPAEREARGRLYDAVRLLLPREYACTAAPAPGTAVNDSVPPARTAHAVMRLTRGATGSHGGGSGGGGSASWPSSRPPYLAFTMHKRGLDTPAALVAVARAAGLPGRIFGYAGVKDRHAVTSQRVTAHRVLPAQLRIVNERMRGVAVGDFSFVSQPLRLGVLAGNRFTLTLRDVRLRGAGAPAAAAVVAAVGADLARWRDTNCARFINFFGEQRFGTGAVPTQDVGRAVLKRDAIAAVALILDPRNSGTSAGSSSGGDESCLEYFARTRDVDGALARAPPSLFVEATVLRALKSHPSPDSPGAAAVALRAVPPRTRNLYMAAYQSSLWNTLASERLRRHGRVPVAGDLVFAARGIDTDVGDGDADEAADAVAGDEAMLPMASADAASAAAPAHATCLPAVVRLTAADVECGRYCIDDVVLPIIGLNVHFPGVAGIDAAATLAHLQADGLAVNPSAAGAEVMSKDATASSSEALVGSADLATAPADIDANADADAAATRAVRALFDSKDTLFRLPGAYRHLIARAGDVSWDWLALPATGGQPPLALTDADALASDRVPRSLTTLTADERAVIAAAEAAGAALLHAAATGPNDACVPSVVAEMPAGEAKASDDSTTVAPAAAQQRLALRICFSLPKSSYATEVLHEIMRGGAD